MVENTEYQKVASVIYNRLGKIQPGARKANLVSRSVTKEIQIGGWHSVGNEGNLKNNPTPRYLEAMYDSDKIKHEDYCCLKKALENVIKLLKEQNPSTVSDQFRAIGKRKLDRKSNKKNKYIIGQTKVTIRFYSWRCKGIFNKSYL